MAAIHIGISAWRYTWRGDSTRRAGPQARIHPSRAVNSIELNESFYALQRPERYAEWYVTRRCRGVLHEHSRAGWRHRRAATIEPLVHRFTVLTVNTHKGFTALNRRFILPELREAVRSVSADVVFLQEVHGTHEHHPKRYNNWPAMPQYEFLADSLWPQFAYGRNAVYPAGDHGNALLSKFQIMRHDNLDVSISGHENRGLLHCVLRLPGEGPEVHAICVHLGLRESHRTEQLQAVGPSPGRTAR